jgi:hypothetical protein
MKHYDSPDNRDEDKIGQRERLDKLAEEYYFDGCGSEISYRIKHPKHSFARDMRHYRHLLNRMDRLENQTFSIRKQTYIE